eukprot:c12620_g1_i3.p1 GENE.c12620_g1_i3~~c12620_g1_i3.p1  ORF type:complete len:277 (+),score=71.61 c12620_g1_i3:136-966(+)
MTSLDMTGFSLSVLQLNDPLLDLLDAPTTAHAWPHTVARPNPDTFNPLPLPDLSFEVVDYSAVPKLTPENAELLKTCLTRACESIFTVHERVTNDDKLVGDGDCGDTFASIATEFLKGVDSYDFTTPASVLAELGTRSSQVGGTSGAVTSLLFTAASSSLLEGGTNTATVNFARASVAAVQAASRYGGATAGDRTMLDALIPAARKFLEGAEAGLAPKDLAQNVAEAANKGAEATKGMFARAGRSSYVPREIQQSVQDPGATAAATWITAVAQVFQ